MFRRKTVKELAAKDLQAARIQLFKAEAALAEATHQTALHTANSARLSNMVPVTNELGKLRTEALYETNVLLLRAQAAVEYAQSEVDSQTKRIARLEGYLSDNNKTASNKV